MLLKNGDGIQWPCQKRIAVMVTFDFDGELLRYSTSGKDQIAFPDYSRGQYGPHTGLHRCLDILKKQDINSTFFVPGFIAEKYPNEVQAIINDGHEIGYHGYMHDERMELSESEERINMMKSQQILEKMYKKKIVGHRAPFNSFHSFSYELMRQYDYLYSSVMKDCDWAYLKKTSDKTHPIVELPTDHCLDDYTYFYFSYSFPGKQSNHSVEDVFSIWKDTFDELADEGDKIMVLKLHPQLIGRSSRARMLDHFITYMKEHGAWITTCEEVALYVKTNSNLLY